MNNIILFICCFVIFAYEYYSKKSDLLSPAVLISIGFTLSSLIFSLTNRTWHYVISGSTIIWILVCLVAFNLGCRFTQIIKIENTNRKYYTIESRDLSNLVFGILIIVEIIYIILRYYSIISVTGTFSLTENALKKYNIASKGNIAFDLPLKILSAVVSIIGVYAAVFFVNATKKKSLSKIKPLMLLICYAVSTVLSSSRIEIIYSLIYLAVFSILLYSSKQNYRITIKTLCLFSIGAFLLGRTFFLLGYLTGKSQIQVNFFDNMAIYGGSSIGAFDHYLKRMVDTTDNVFTLSFKGIYTLLSYLGVDINRTATDTIGFVQLGDMQHTTNVYTCLMVVFHDYGYFGAPFVMFVQGCFYQYLYIKAKMPRESVFSVWTIIYVYVSPFIILSSITDRFFTQIFTISSIVSFITMSIINLTLLRYENKVTGESNERLEL
ncbi:MAG: oligosaccharide repeat unit polymerase [Ruminococcus sp.]|jgi:oligosaccharide repeat unit polymerase|nr:oligosaccharide repeat unit polymerase [Ruminococcus sp.]